MSLAEVTRKCFQNGISAQKWANLCQLLKRNNPTSLVDFESDLSNSILTLFHLYPADPSLQGYIKHALHTGLLTLSSFLVTFLQAAKSSNLHDTATLDVLCRLVLEARYTSGIPAVGSLVRFGDPTISVLATVQDGLNLLRLAHSLPLSPFHSLISSASELVVLLLSCVGDMTQVSTAQAMVHFADVHDMLQTLRLDSNIRSVLENFALSLSIILGDDAKMAQEAQMMQTLQLALGKGDVMGSGSESDLVSCSLLCRHLLGSRATAFGSGNTPLAVAMVVATFRGMSWSPSGFYTQLLLSAVSCLAQGSTDAKSCLLWRSFVISRLPHLLILFEQVVNSEALIDADWRSATQAAVTALYNRSDLLVQCDIPSSRSNADDASQDSDKTVKEPSFFLNLLQYYSQAKLLNPNSTLPMGPALSSRELQSQVGSESSENGLDLDVFIDSKLSVDANIEETLDFLQRVVEDYSAHPTFAQVIQKRFVTLSESSDVEGLSHICKVLYKHDSALDVVSIHVKMSDIVAHTLAFVEDYDCESVGDPQTAVSHLGDVVLFLQSTLVQFQLTASSFNLGDRLLHPGFLLSTSTVYRVTELSNDDSAAFLAWSKALFDSGSEGIEDNILRATNPKTLLKLSSSLVSHAVAACSNQRMDADVLKNGISYFTGPLLNWTLVGAIKALLIQILHKDFAATIHLEVLQSLVQARSCPEPVLRLTAHDILKLMSDRKSRDLGQKMKFDSAAVRSIASQALRITGRDFRDNLDTLKTEPQPLALNTPVLWLDQPQGGIRDAITSARSGKAPSLDISRCVTIAGPFKFLRLFWHELSTAAAQMGEMESCRRLATFALTCPPNSKGNVPPLLPIFIHKLLPTLLPTIDQQIPPEQTINIEFLVNILSSSLTGILQIEWALRAVDGESRHPTGQSSAATARRLAIDLRKSSSPTAGIIMQRLSSSPAFVANFPMMVSG